MSEDKHMISYSGFHAIFSYVYAEFIVEFCERYFGLTKAETDSIMDEVLRRCWKAACKDDQLLRKHEYMIRKACPPVAIAFLREKRKKQVHC